MSVPTQTPVLDIEIYTDSSKSNNTLYTLSKKNKKGIISPISSGVVTFSRKVSGQSDKNIAINKIDDIIGATMILNNSETVADINTLNQNLDSNKKVEMQLTMDNVTAIFRGDIKYDTTKNNPKIIISGLTTIDLNIKNGGSQKSRFKLRAGSKSNKSKSSRGYKCSASKCKQRKTFRRR